MIRNKICTGTGVLVAVIVVAGLVWYVRTRDRGGSMVATRPGSVALNSGGEDLKSVPLNDANDNSKTADNSSVLKVMPAQDTGQTSLGGSSGNKAAAADSSPKGSIDSPDSFMQYDKYKDQAHSLYSDIDTGNGVVVAEGKKVAVNYKGWLTNGQLFDQSKADSPFVFTPGEHRVIVGWEEGIMGMKVGGKRLLIVPPAVGYGAQGKDPIPANAVMVFEIELVAVQP